MLRVNGKKINTAFGRLRERRVAVGLVSTAAETPEQEAKRIEEEISTAIAAADISSLLNTIVQASSITTEDFIKKTCGALLFMYYTYLDKFHQYPLDIDDIIDGMLYLDAKGYITKKATEKK